MTSHPDHVKTDAQFDADTARGATWEAYVCRALIRAGIGARLLPKARRPSYERRGAYRDAGDIELDDGRVLDVKSKALRFGSDPASWPDGEEVWLGQPHHWDAAEPKPLAFVLVSTLTGAKLVVPGRTFESWTRAERAWRADHRQPTLIAPASTLKRWTELLDFLRP